MLRFFRHNNELHKGEKFLHQLSTYQLSETNSAPWNQIQILFKELFLYQSPNETCTHDSEESSGFRHGGCMYA
jgi:hypothetical protein